MIGTRDQFGHRLGSEVRSSRHIKTALKLRSWQHAAARSLQPGQFQDALSRRNQQPTPLDVQNRAWLGRCPSLRRLRQSASPT